MTVTIFDAPQTTRRRLCNDHRQSRPKQQPCASTRPCRCSPSPVSPSGSGDTTLSRRLAHDIRQPLTCTDSPCSVWRARPTQKPKSRAGASTPARLANTVPRPLLGRFHSFQAKTVRRRIALNAVVASIRRGGISCDNRRPDPAWRSGLLPPPPWQPPALGPSWTNLICSKAHRCTVASRSTHRAKSFDVGVLPATSRGHTRLDAQVG